MKTLLSFAALALLLTACGGSGSNGQIGLGGRSSQSVSHASFSVQKNLTHLTPLSTLVRSDSGVKTKNFQVFADAHVITGTWGDGANGDVGNNSKTAVEVTTTGEGFGAFQAYGGVDYPFVATSGMTVSQLTWLSTDIQMSFGNCSVGTPRFVAQLDQAGQKNVFIYPSCSQSDTWSNTGKLLSQNDVDPFSSGCGQPNVYGTWAVIVSNCGSDPIYDLYLVMDDSNSTGETAEYDHTQINSTIINY